MELIGTRADLAKGNQVNIPELWQWEWRGSPLVNGNVDLELKMRYGSSGRVFCSP